MEKDPQAPDWALVLSGMEAKAAAWLSAAKSLRAALAAETGGQVAEERSIVTPDQRVSIPRGAFHRKTATEAIKIYLEAAGRKQTNKEIAQALKDGGLESTGSFDNYVTHGLFRLKKEGAVLRFDDGWGLAEWYSESLRNRVAPEKPQRKNRSKPKSKKASEITKSKTSKAETPSPAPQADNIHEMPVTAKAS